MKDIPEHIEVFYNREQLHFDKKYLSPMNYERQLIFVSGKVLTHQISMVTFAGKMSLVQMRILLLALVDVRRLI